MKYRFEAEFETLYEAENLIKAQDMRSDLIAIFNVARRVLKDEDDSLDNLIVEYRTLIDAMETIKDLSIQYIED